MPNAWPPSRASSPTCRSPPSDARFPGNDTTTMFRGEKRRKANLSATCINTHAQLGYVSQRESKFSCQKRFKLAAETLTPFHRFNEEDGKLGLGKNEYSICNYYCFKMLLIYLFPDAWNYWLIWERNIVHFFHFHNIFKSAAHECSEFWNQFFHF